MNYFVVNDDSLQDLMEDVRVMLQDGWEIAPGFFALRYTYIDRKGYEEVDYSFFQPLIKRAKPETSVKE